MSAPALTVAVTAHGEGRLLRPTLRSVSAALDRFGASGDSAELLIMCDNADQPTRQEAERWAARDDLSFAVRIAHVSLGESGATRNAAAHTADGEFLAFVDGDDLVSSNYFVDAVAILRRDDSPVILHPELIVSFGARSLLWRAESTRTHDIDYRDLLRHNLWPASCVTRAEILRTTPYRSLAPEAGYGPEDWLWNIDTSAAGVGHDVVPDTVFFYRVRDAGGVNNRHAGSILPQFDLEGLRRTLPAVDSADEGLPSAPRSGVDRLYARLLPFARSSTRWLSWEAKHVIYRAARSTIRLVTRQGRTSAGRDLASEPVLAIEIARALREATEIEPAISWTAFSFDSLEVWRARDDGYADLLVDTIDRIGDRGGAIVAVPWVGIGGADTVSLNYAKALVAAPRFAGRTTMLGTFLADRTVHEQIPGTLLYSHIDERWLALPLHLRQRFIAQLIVMLRPELIVCVNSFHVTEALRSYPRQITDGTRVFATLFSFDRIGAGYPTNPLTDDSQRQYMDQIDGLITDNSRSAALMDEILALDPSSVIVHRQPTGDEIPPLPRGTRAYNNEFFTPLNPFRVLWPHRLDREKRPDVLPRLARELTRRGLPVAIDVWGSYVLGDDGDGLMADLRDSGVIYRGPYSGGLPALDTYSYHALLLTSQNEGLPLVLVQALLRGLPVVASAVGGVVDIIRDDETGILTDGPDDVDGFADAIERMMGDLEVRRRIIETGYRFAAQQHSWDAFARSVQQDLIDGDPAPHPQSELRLETPVVSTFDSGAPFDQR